VIVCFGIDWGPAFIVSALRHLLPIYLNRCIGVRKRDPPNSSNDGPAVCFRNCSRCSQQRVYLARARSSILLGLRFWLGVMWLTLDFAETIAAQSGIGYGMRRARVHADRRLSCSSILLYMRFGQSRPSFRW